MFENDELNNGQSSAGNNNDYDDKNENIGYKESEDYKSYQQNEEINYQNADNTEDAYKGPDNYYENEDGYQEYQDESQDYVEREQSYYNNGSYFSGGGSYIDDNYSNYQNSNTPKRKSNIVPIVLVAVIAGIVLFAGAFIAAKSVIDDYNSDVKTGKKEEATEQTEKVEYPSIGTTDNTVKNEGGSKDTGTGSIVITDVSAVVDNVMPSIVAITNKSLVENYGNDWFFGGGFGFDDYYGYGNGGDEEEYAEYSAGSGIIIKQTETELLIVTNNHVVSGADSLSIQFVNGVDIVGVTKSTDESADLAIVAIALKDIDEETMKAIKVASLGSSDDTRVGEGVVAIGNALGYGQSVTTGVISAKDREIAVDNNEMVVLQTDAAINGGNSGGALLNYKGEVIGINVAKYSSSDYSGSASIEGMGFAIPVSQAMDILNELMTKETRNKVAEDEKSAIGISGIDVDYSASQAYGIPMGVYIKEIVEGGAAERAGLRETDVITKFDGQSVDSMESLKEKLLYYKAGETVKITIERNNSGGYKEKEIEITLDKAKENK